MNLNNIIDELYSNRNASQSDSMKAYMKNQFEFLGIRAPLRNKIWSNYFREAKKTKLVDWDFVNKCWELPYREFQYTAAYYLRNMQDFLDDKDIIKIKNLILKKSWWDTIDTLDKIVGHISYKYPEVVTTIIEWSTSDNIWLRRVAINHQLLRKSKTDTELLEKILVNNFGTNEFFINKAIGWALRDYSKTNPKWVEDFLHKYRNEMSNLSIKEASKYLQKKA
ncbi:DNA alkylation repair protein [Gemella sp. GH3]|uniref:DNA alkylation repair protein n=1 Tax=unclassified Gemella TaxID=2624949 RepID=UPI0015CFB91B|nr:MULTISPECIES: DNA alkylation repair protein [unclassified Gemella]MBF0713582.1 DNA alkylation repair protein [Gemella sp. GH3.1]NYS50534.1 DNA alkylation repair protein [Gemella sp. GH3]